MKTKLLILSILITFFSCNKSDQKIEESIDAKKIDSVIDIESHETENPKELVKAPDFSLADINGKRYDLADFKGKYIYLDIWATWCGPCKVQIPFMKELEKQFQNAPIYFVSISLDKLEDKPVWEKMVRENQMSGVQLFAGQEDNFGFDYKIEYIPTFMILDKEGNTMIDRAPAPMDYQTGKINKELVDIFKMMN
ncbi:TlpA family protein disulfide reductase [Empedobacter brevis]|uniref:TlpA family protein disulfide reductase n=1 Tax=Empedobacter brevis TaxID=247 RepID=UPI0039AF9335